MREIFNKIVNNLEKYVTENKLEALVLGVSGGLDSSVCSAIIHEVSLKTSVKIIGVSLPIKNKPDEIRNADIIGEAFFKDGGVYYEKPLKTLYESYISELESDGIIGTPISNGNIQARLRMIYLYNLASINKGMVIDTDNLTEHHLGFFTLHGDVGDYTPLAGLWKTEVYKLAEWLRDVHYEYEDSKRTALDMAIEIIPTDGLGISSSDLEQIGGTSYSEVDEIIRAYLYEDVSEVIGKYSKETVEKVISRVKGSGFKRNNPIRETLE